MVVAIKGIGLFKILYDFGLGLRSTTTYDLNVINVICTSPVERKLDLINLGQVNGAISCQVDAHLSPLVLNRFGVCTGQFTIGPDFLVGSGCIKELDAHSIIGFAIVISGGVINPEAQLICLRDINRARVRVGSKGMPFAAGAGCHERRSAAMDNIGS